MPQYVDPHRASLLSRANDADHAPPGQPALRIPGSQAANAAAPAGMLLLPGQGATSSVALTVAGPGAVPDERWLPLADPLKHVAGYLCLRDRIALARTSLTMRWVLGPLADTTLERAQQLSTLSDLSQILARLEGMPDVGARLGILKALAKRTGCFARPHRYRAWHDLLHACDRLPPAMQGAMLACLAMAPTEARVSSRLLGRGHTAVDSCDRLAMLEKRLAGLPAAGRAELTFALLSVREPTRLGKLYDEPPPRQPFDLAAHLALVPFLPASDHRRATHIAMGYHLRSPSTPAAHWLDGFAAACAARHPGVQAWTLVALMEVRTVDGECLLSELEAPTQAWRRILAQAERLPPGDAVNTGAALARCLREKWACGQFQSQAVEAMWQFAGHSRFDIDQRSELLVSLPRQLSRPQWDQGWSALLEACAEHGITPSRRNLLRGMLDRLPASGGTTSASEARWETAMEAIEAALSRSQAPSSGASLAAALCSMMVRDIASLPEGRRPAALDRLLGLIDRLPPVWRGEPLRDLLAVVRAPARIVSPRLGQGPPLVRAQWLATLLADAGEPSLAPMQRFLQALGEAMPAASEVSALLADGLAKSTQAAIMLESNLAALQAGLPALIDRIDVAAQPTLATEMATFAIVARWRSHYSARPLSGTEAGAYRDVADFLTGVLKRLPPEALQALLLALRQGPRMRQDGVATRKASTEWILDVAAVLPPVYRAEVLRQWAEDDTFNNCVAGFDPTLLMAPERASDLGWPPRRAVWQAIMKLPESYLAPLLCATTEWFFADHLSPGIFLRQGGEDFETAKAQWHEALQRLPARDRLDANSLLHPEFAVTVDMIKYNLAERI